jgi:uncharacterized membrane protein YbhN (UPF0104 family)
LLVWRWPNRDDRRPPVQWRNTLRWLTTAIKTLRSRVNWKALGLVVSIVIAVVAFIALYHSLKNIDVDRVMAALRLMRWSQIALAAGLVALSYASLTLYDLLALRTIGRHDIPYRIAALASFTSYPIAHGTGAVLPVSSAVRYRVYAAHGLGVIDVAKICFLTGLTFWLGNLTALGLSVLVEPDAIGLIDQLPLRINQLLAVTTLMAIAGYLIWTWCGNRTFGNRRWSLTLPSGTAVLFQIGIGIVDLGAAALAMYVLIPVELNDGVARVVVVFIAATLLGFASHAPAGLGVFDATIMIGLGGEHKEQLVAALLLFRLLYHMVPFVLALSIFAALEATRALRDRKAA